jgi:hypothetical protein
MAAGLALLLVLEKMGKSVKIVSPNFTLPPGHDFLPKNTAIEQRLTSLRQFVISVDVGRTKLDALSYGVRGDRLHIYLSPKQGIYEAKDVTTSAGKFAHDVIVVVDVPSPEQLGGLYDDNAEFFYQVPVVNIDHHPENSRFGNANVVDVVASSVSEIVFELMSVLGKDHLDEHIATSLSPVLFLKRGVPKQARHAALVVDASHLMSAGRVERSIQHLYQTKTLPTLKLWGRLLVVYKPRVMAESFGQRSPLTIFRARPRQQGCGWVLDELMTEAASAVTASTLNKLVLCSCTSLVAGTLVHAPEGLTQGERCYGAVTESLADGTSSNR